MELPELFRSYIEYCIYRNQAEKERRIDLSSATWFYPTTLLPLCNFIREKKNSIGYIPPSDLDVANYVDLMSDESQFEFSGNQYCPIVALPAEKKSVEPLLQKIYRLLENGRDCGGENAFKYIISELVDNIYNHSEFTVGFAMAQRYPRKEFVEVCIFDNGISIPGCYAKHGLVFKDCEAIGWAINGVSTDSNERGYGLGTSIRILTQGLKGQSLIVSGKGSLYLEGEKQIAYSLDAEELFFKGTLIRFRIPFTANVVDIYHYIG